MKRDTHGRPMEPGLKWLLLGLLAALAVFSLLLFGR